MYHKRRDETPKINLLNHCLKWEHDSGQVFTLFGLPCLWLLFSCCTFKQVNSEHTEQAMEGKKWYFIIIINYFHYDS